MPSQEVGQCIAMLWMDAGVPLLKELLQHAHRLVTALSVATTALHAESASCMCACLQCTSVEQAWHPAAQSQLGPAHLMHQCSSSMHSLFVLVVVND
jgi:hypothetical protein